MHVACLCHGMAGNASRRRQFIVMHDAHHAAAAYLIIVHWNGVMHQIADGHQGTIPSVLQLDFGDFCILRLLLESHTLLLQLRGILLFLQASAR